jgi:hypothetical protein
MKPAKRLKEENNRLNRSNHTRMKRILWLICIALAGTMPALRAQDENRTTFGIRAGVNFQNYNGKDEKGDKLKNDLITGFHAGVNVEFPVAPDFVLQPGLLFTVKGTKTTEAVGTGKIHVNYLELPVNFIYKPGFGNGRLLLGLGPYIAYGIGGKAKLTGSGSDIEQDVKFENKLSASQVADNEFYVRPFDAGANLLAGYELGSGISLQLNAQLGLLKINPGYEGDSNDETSVKNTGFGISVGYRF